MPRKLQREDPTFSYNDVREVTQILREELDFPVVRANISTLGGKSNTSILLTISKDPREYWPNDILENSRYAKLHINREGRVEQYSGWKLKLRSFTAKNMSHMIKRINTIKEI